MAADTSSCGMLSTPLGMDGFQAILVTAWSLAVALTG
jgi:hypothetical protein